MEKNFTQGAPDKETELFFARISELMKRADRGETAVGDFLSPREIHYAKTMLVSSGYRGRFAFFGGFTEAERKRLICLPEYALYGVDTADDEAVTEAAVLYAADDISVLRISGSGFKKLSHRDFMGSILALGIKRTVLGDISVDGDDGAYVFCDSKIADYIIFNLERVGRDAVKVKKTELPENFAPERRTVTVSDSVASMRADCIVAALTNISRERAKDAIIGGAVELDYETLYKPDLNVEEGSILSVRGYGKFKITGTDGKTKRGRLRLVAEKYI